MKTAEKTGILNDLVKGKKRMIFTDDELAKDNDIYIDENIVIKDKNSAGDADDLETELNAMYSDYKSRRSERDAKFKAKQARGGDNEEEWTGFNEKNVGKEEEEPKDYIEDNDDEDIEGDSDGDEAISNLISKIKGEDGDHKLSSKARMIFNDPIFNNVEADLPVQIINDGMMSSEAVGDLSKLSKKRKHQEIQKQEEEEADSSDESSSDDSDFEIVANDNVSEDFDSDYDSEEEKNKQRKKSILKILILPLLRP